MLLGSMAYCPQSNPQALGNVTVTNPGTPVQITLTLQSTTAGSGHVVNSTTDAVLCQQISIVASPITHSGSGNIGAVYLGSATMVRATLAGVIAVIQAGQSYPLSQNVANNVFDANKLYIDADNAGDGVYGALFTQ